MVKPRLIRAISIDYETKGRLSFDITVRKGHFTFLTLLGGWIFWETRQVGIIFLGLYLILGQAMPLRPAPLTKEDLAKFDELQACEDSN